jgi:hypothetical protein
MADLCSDSSADDARPHYAQPHYAQPHYAQPNAGSDAISHAEVRRHPLCKLVACGVTFQNKLGRDIKL